MFAGHRQELPESLTSRFLFVSFERLQESDLVVFGQRSMMDTFVKHGVPVDGDDYCLQLARCMVPAHMELERLTTSPGSSFVERRAYAELTIRDLMKWCEGVAACIVARGRGAFPFLAAPSFKPSSTLASLLFWEAWAVYGARFRLTESRNCVSMILREAVGAGVVSTSYHEASLARVQHLDHVAVSYGNFTVSSWHGAPLASAAKQCPFPREMIAMHSAVAEYLFSDDVVKRLGVAAAFPSLLVASARWLELAKKAMPSVLAKDELRSKFALVGACMYASVVRAPDDVVQHRMLALAASTFGPGLPAQFSAEDVYDCEVHTQSGWAPPSLALTARLGNTLRLIVRAASLQQPVLLVGCDGTGKSDLIVSLAAMIGKSLERVCVTGETDSAELVGQLSPATLRWSDGPVTRAIRNQSWCLLDNLDAADAVVMERLNPLLEASPVWQLMEKDDGEVRGPLMAVYCWILFHSFDSLSPVRRGPLLTWASPRSMRQYYAACVEYRPLVICAFLLDLLALLCRLSRFPATQSFCCWPPSLLRQLQVCETVTFPQPCTTGSALFICRTSGCR